MKRIMYIECKGDGLDGSGRIGWVELSRTASGWELKDACNYLKVKRFKVPYRACAVRTDGI